MRAFFCCLWNTIEIGFFFKHSNVSQRVRYLHAQCALVSAVPCDPNANQYLKCIRLSSLFFSLGIFFLVKLVLNKTLLRDVLDLAG